MKQKQNLEKIRKEWNEGWEKEEASIAEERRAWQGRARRCRARNANKSVSKKRRRDEVFEWRGNAGGWPRNDSEPRRRKRSPRPG